MNQTDKRIRQELEAKRKARDEARRRLDVLEAEVRLLETFVREAGDEPADAPKGGGRKARTALRLDAMATILATAGATGAGAADLARRLSETGDTITRGAVDDLLKRYTDRFERTPDGQRWRNKSGAREAAMG